MHPNERIFGNQHWEELVFQTGDLFSSATQSGSPEESELVSILPTQSEVP